MDKRDIHSHIKEAVNTDIGGRFSHKDFDNNDLGINFQTNYYSIYGMPVRILNPTKLFF
jgi:hypothetical protein